MSPRKLRLAWAAPVGVLTWVVVGVTTGRVILGFASGVFVLVVVETLYDIYWRGTRPPHED